MDVYSKLSYSDGASIGLLVNRVARSLRRLADSRLSPLGLSSGYLPVLTALLGGRALSQKALTEQAGIEQPTMAATLARMERDGVVQRRPDPADRRSVLFSLSPATLEKTAAITSVIGSLNETALAPLDDADRAKLRQTLAAVIASADEALVD